MGNGSGVNAASASQQKRSRDYSGSEANLMGQKHASNTNEKLHSKQTGDLHLTPQASHDETKLRQRQLAKQQKSAANFLQSQGGMQLSPLKDGYESHKVTDISQKKT